MKIMKSILATSLATALLMGVPAQAQWAVFDAAAAEQNLEQIAHMVSQLKSMADQLQTAKSQLDQAKRQYEAVTGSRGMGALVTDTNRNYLPSDWEGALGGGNSSLKTLARQISKEAGYLSDTDLSGINQAYRDALRRSGDRAAYGQAANAAVFEESGERFNKIKSLMDRIDTAGDEKAIMDLQARIQVEQVMLQNELIRAQSMNAMVQQQQQVERERQKQKAMSESFTW